MSKNFRTLLTALRTSPMQTIAIFVRVERRNVVVTNKDEKCTKKNKKKAPDCCLGPDTLRILEA